MTTIYKDERYQVDICYGWSYFEIFGLAEDQEYEIEEYYKELKNIGD